MTISRRKLLQAGALGGGMAMLPLGLMQKAWAGSTQALVRYNVLSPEGDKMLRIYAAAVKKMMAKPTTDPLSWTFQWYTHAMPSKYPKAQTITEVFGSGSSPQKALAESMWWTCEPHSSGNNDAFLPWHRMYVLYFEQIIREVSGEPKFTLPFWDYTGPYSAAGNNYSVMPKQFLLKDDPVFGSLYRPDRNPNSNAGKPVVNNGSPLDLSCMKWSDYSGKFGFCNNIDNNPHGSLHGDVGNSLGMGAVPWAAYDPVFWVHHANIDRIWADWNRSGGKNPSDSKFLSESWVFADKAGKAVTTKVSQVLDTTTCPYPYIYSEYPQRPKASLQFTTTQKKFQLQAQSLVAAAPSATANAISLGGKATTVALVTHSLSTSTNAAQPAARTFALQLKAQPAIREYALSFEAIAADSEPGNSYDVYLGLPAGAAPDPEYRVGSISMFGVGNQAMHGGHHAGSKDVAFLVSEQMQKLLKVGTLTDAPAVTLVPVGDPNPGSAPTIGNISLQTL